MFTEGPYIADTNVELLIAGHIPVMKVDLRINNFILHSSSNDSINKQVV